MPMASTCTRTSRSLGTGTGTSRSSIPPGPESEVTTMAFMARDCMSRGQGMPRRGNAKGARAQKNPARTPRVCAGFSPPFLRESLAAHLPLAGRLKRKNLQCELRSPSKPVIACLGKQPGIGAAHSKCLAQRCFTTKKQGGDYHRGSCKAMFGTLVFHPSEPTAGSPGPGTKLGCPATLTLHCGWYILPMLSRVHGAPGTLLRFFHSRV